ncbi:MAG: hypothetical protein Q9192_008323 [Flavoplaca navasiana]
MVDQKRTSAAKSFARNPGLPPSGGHRANKTSRHAIVTEALAASKKKHDMISSPNSQKPVSRAFEASKTNDFDLSNKLDRLQEYSDLPEGNLDDHKMVQDFPDIENTINWGLAKEKENQRREETLNRDFQKAIDDFIDKYKSPERHQDNVAGYLRAYLYARNKELLDEDVLDFMLDHMHQTLPQERSAAVWTKVIKTWLADVEDTRGGRLDALLNGCIYRAMHTIIARVPEEQPLEGDEQDLIKFDRVLGRFQDETGRWQYVGQQKTRERGDRDDALGWHTF